MSNKQEDETMQPAVKAVLVPKRRFPEFRNSGQWSTMQMGELYVFKGNNSLSRDKLNYENGSIKNIHYGDIHTKFATLFDISKEVAPYVNATETQYFSKAENYCVEGDMVFADASEDLEDIGKSIEIFKLNDECVVSGLHTILARQSAALLVLGFGGYLFKSHAIRKQIQKESQGAKVLGISGGRLARISVPFPPDKAEQQKIADCLASLDELITLEAQQLDTLKTHKKGLMQQLFPAEGETLPKLRFTEFRDAGEWEKVCIGQIAELYKGKGISKSDIVQGGKQPCIRYGELYTFYGEVIDYVMSSTNLSPCDLFLSKKNDVIIPSSGETKIDIATAACVIREGIALGGDLNIIRSSQNGIFLSYSLNGALKNAIAKIAQGDTVVHLYANQLKLLDIAVPSEGEQRKIAECLVSLDDLITAQAQKLDTLKTHKKGLMQKLFPSLEEVGA